MTSSNVLLELLTQYDTTKFHDHWSSNMKVKGGGAGESAPRPYQILKSPACLGLTLSIGLFSNEWKLKL